MTQTYFCDVCNMPVDIYDLMAHDAICGTGDRVTFHTLEEMPVPLDTVETKEKDTTMAQTGKVQAWLGPLSQTPYYLDANHNGRPIPGIAYDSSGKIKLTEKGYAAYVKGGQKLFKAWRNQDTSGTPPTTRTFVDTESDHVAGETTELTSGQIGQLLDELRLVWDSTTATSTPRASVEAWKKCDRLFKQVFRYNPLQSTANRLGYNGQLSDEHKASYFDSRMLDVPYATLWQLPVAVKRAATTTDVDPFADESDPFAVEVKWSPAGKCHYFLNDDGKAIKCNEDGSPIS